jgi:hypothetical protein
VKGKLVVRRKGGRPCFFLQILRTFVIIDRINNHCLSGVSEPLSRSHEGFLHNVNPSMALIELGL